MNLVSFISYSFSTFFSSFFSDFFLVYCLLILIAAAVAVVVASSLYFADSLPFWCMCVFDLDNSGSVSQTREMGSDPNTTRRDTQGGGGGQPSINIHLSDHILCPTFSSLSFFAHFLLTTMNPGC